MADFPELIPASRAYSLGAVPATQRGWLDALEVAHRFGLETTAHTLRLEYDESTTDSQWLEIRNHWAGQQGGILPFSVPALVWSGHDDYGQIVDGLQWRYASPPTRPDGDAGLSPGTVELVAERIDQPVISDDAAPWFGTVVPLAPVGTDPGPPPVIVPAGLPDYVLQSWPELEQAYASPVEPPTSPDISQSTGGQDTGTSSFESATGEFISLPINPKPGDDTPAPGGLSGPGGAKNISTGDLVTYTPSCTDPGPPTWYFQPDVPECNTSGKSSAQLRTDLQDGYGISPPSGMSTDDLRKLYCKAVEASGYGLPTYKNDTAAKIGERINEAKSRGRQPGQPIEMSEFNRAPSSSPNLTPWRNGSGRVFTVDKCGVSYSAGVIFNEKRKGRPQASIIPGWKNWKAPDPAVIGDVFWYPNFVFALKLPYLVNPNNSITSYDDNGDPVIINVDADFYKIKLIGYDDGTTSGVFVTRSLNVPGNPYLSEWVYEPPD